VPITTSLGEYRVRWRFEKRRRNADNPATGNPLPDE
jgi:hypothetical protein